VILATDGDKMARRALETASANLGLRCISASAGNPTPLSGAEIVALVKQATHDPVVVMVDDKGHPGQGCGERAIKAIASDPELQVIGAIAVAADTRRTRGVEVDLSVTRDGRLVPGAVDKEGEPVRRGRRLRGDTVDILAALTVPVIVGVGDIGKMEGADRLSEGAPVTTRALRAVLEQSQERH
jgi:stage V sporulation protein AE